MECNLCGTVNRATARFCGGCGSPLARRCPSCKAELDMELAFCDQCGSALDAAPAATSSPTADTPASGAVRKTVTVLFADLGGSTGFGERTDPEISRQVLARYHALLQDTIDTHGGTVAKFMGDGMMATFGIPEVAEDDAHRAVRAGTDIQRRFEGFAAEVQTRYGEVLTLRVGVNTGEVVIAAGDADLVGDALNVAARLEKACRPGHVLVGDETWRITRGELAYEPLGVVTVAGRAGPVGTYEMVASEAAASEPVAPFVGRVGETARLHAAFDHARAAHAAVLVTVLGSPGMGKTRLSRELASTLAADEDATTFEIRCDRSGGATFAPFADLIREAAGISEIGDEGDVGADSTRERIGALVTDDADRARVVDVLAGVLGAAPARSVEETFWALRRIVESLASERPLVVVIDDIQWAEPKLLDLLEHLAEWVQAAAVLLVCLARPELRELRPALTELGRRVADVLALDGLDAAATADLASGLLGSRLPAELVDRLPASTDGNPLFVRELVRMLVDDAVIRRRDDGTWELAIDAEAIEVPPTIQSLLATRVERLPADELRVLELASVVGAEFSVGALRELAGEQIAVPPVLERLRRKELVEPTGSYWGDDPLHRFHHVLIRDAAYRRLLKTTRAELHRRVGQWTDAIAADLVGEQETAIAFHYEQAHRYRMELGTVDDETDRLGRRAAELLSVAARRALDREDLTSAGALARRALTALPDADVDERADLLLIACECFLSSGDVTAGAPLVDALDALAGANEQRAAWAACYRAQLVGLTDPDGVVAAEEMATAAAAILEQLADGAGEAKAHQVRAGLLARLGRVGEAEVVLDLALGAARASDDRRRVTAVLGAAPQAALFGPSPVARAGGRCLDVVRLLRITTASPSVEATSMRCQAVLEALRGRFDVSRSMLGSARSSLEELGLRHGLLETDLFTGMVELIAGDAAAAIGPLRSAYEGLGTLGVGADAGQAAALLATALLARGETDEAELMAAESEALAGQNLKTAIAWRVARAQVLAARGELAAGAKLAAEAVDIAAATDLVLDHGDACVVLADLRALSGDGSGAEQARSEARRLYEAKGATVPAARLASSERHEPEPSPSAPVREPSPVGTRGETRTPIAENAASRFMEPLRVAFNAKDRVALGQLIGPGSVHEDRRSIVAAVGLDPRGRLDDLGAAIDQGFSFAEPVIIAVRGERLALSLMVTRTPAGDESARLSVNELDAEGRLARSVLFDEADLASALAELDVRYFLGEGAVHQDLLSVLGVFGAAMDRGDDDAARDLMATDFRMVDRQVPALFGEGDREAYLAASRTRTATERDGARVGRVMHVSGRALLVVNDDETITELGDVYERVNCYVLAVNAAGLVSRFEVFDETDFAAALARLDALGSEASGDPRTPVAQNTATRVHALACAAIIARRADDLRLLITSDFVQEDRRTLVSLPTLGRHGLAENFALMHDQGYVSMVTQPVAVRGERLCLDLVTARTEAGDESALLAVVELDDDDREIGNVVFDADDLAAAVAELDRAYYSGEGAPFQRVLGACGRYAAASERDDYEALRDGLAPDFVYVDRQLLGSGEGDRDYFIEFSRTRTAEGSLVNRVMYVNEHALLAVHFARMTSDQGGVYERLVCIVIGVDTDDRINRIEMYADADFATALARLDELGQQIPADRRPAVIENAATLADARAAKFIARADHATPADLALAEGFVLEDRRTVVALPDLDAGGLAENFAAMRAQGYTIQAPEPLAVRGDRLCLSRRIATTEGGDESAVLALTELDGQGSYRRVVFFDADDLSSAMAELDDRYLTGEGAQDARVLRVCKAFGDANERRDFDVMRDMLSADFVMSDRTRLGYGEGDREYFDAASRTRADVAPSDGLAINRLLRIEGDALLTVAEGHHITTEGSDYAWVSCIVFQVDADDRIRRAEYFDEDNFATALDRLQELGGVAPVDARTAEAANLATRVHARALAAINAGDSKAQRALTARDFAQDDRRAVVAVPDQDARGIARYHDIMLEQGYEILPPEPLAVRGDRLSLARVIHRTATGDESILLAIIELDDHGLVVRATAFDDDDRDAAEDDLDERFLADEGAGSADLIGTSVRLRCAHRDRNWAALRDVFDPGVVFRDHRRLGWADGNRDEIVGMFREGTELSPDMRLRFRCQHSVGDALLLTNVSTGTTRDGSAVEWALHALITVGPDHRIEHLEYFDEADFARALARLDELGSQAPADPRTPRSDEDDLAAAVAELDEAFPGAGAVALLDELGAGSATPVSPVAENAVTRRIVRLLDLMNRGENAAAFAMDAVADDVVRFDRRHTVSAPTVVDGGGFLENARAIYEVFGVVHPEPVAVRDDRLALIRLHCGDPPGFTMQMLVVYELDAEGRIVREADFDEEQIDAALDELNDRYLAVEGDGSASPERAAVRLDHVYRSRDWAGLRAVITDDFESVDHRQLGFGASDADEFVALCRTGLEMLPDYQQVAREVVVHGRAFLATCDGWSTDDPEGHQWVIHFVARVADDQVDRIEWFNEEDIEAARVRLRELGGPTPGAPTLTNRAVGVLTRAGELLMTDVEAALDLFAEDAASENRQAGPLHGVTASGRDGWRTALTSWATTYATVRFEPVAVRGDHVAALRYEFAADGFVTRALAVVELDAHGLVRRLVNFDDDDLGGALDELDERYLARDGAEHDYVVQRMSEFRAAQQRRDWGAIEALVAEDFVFVDHRPIGLPESDRAGYVGVMRASEQQTPGARLIHRSLAVRGDAVLARTGRVGSTPDGFEYEWEQIAAMVWAAGLLRRVELFSVDDAPAAKERFEQLAEDSQLTPYVDNRLVRITERLQWLGRHTDDRPALLAADCVLDDRRVGVNAGAVTGDVAVEASIRSGIDVFGALDLEPLAVRGDRLALYRWAFVTDAGFEAPGLCVIETGDDDLTRGITSFEESDRAAAIEFLETRHVELQGGAITVQERATAAGEAAFNARDWDALAALFASGVRYVNHTPLGDGGGVDEYVANLQVFAQQVPTAAIVYAKVTSSNRAGLSVLPFTGTTPEGNRYSWSLYQVTLMDEAGRMSRFEIFGDDQWDDAVACFERWAGEARSTIAPSDSRLSGPNNAASCALARVGELAWNDIDAAVDQFAPDASGATRQTGPMAGASAFGRDDWRNVVASFVDTYDAVRFDPLAVRGDRLALVRYEFSTEGFVIAALLIVELDDVERIQRIESFDEDDALDAAIAELDERFIVGEGAEHEYLIRRFRDLNAARRAEHWDGYADLFHADFVGADHRTLGLPVIDKATLLASQREMAALVPTTSFVHRWQRWSGDVVLALVEAEGVSAEGNPYEWSQYALWQLAAGRWIRTELFPIDDLAGAEARFAELTAEPRAPYVDNDAVRTLIRLEWLQRAGRRSDVARLVADDIVILDRRRGVPAPDLVGPEAFLASVDASEDLFGSIGQTEFVAVRGSRVALTRWTMTAESGFETRGHDLVEVDDAGRLCRFVTFGEEDLAGAVDEMERRHEELRGDAYTEWERQGADGERALNHRDFDTLAAMLAPEFTIEDHRQFGMPMTKESYLEYLRVLIDQAPDFAFVFAKGYVAGNATLSVIPFTGTTPEGNRYEWSYLQLVRVDDQGRALRFEFFDAERWDDAVARFDELAVEEPPLASSPAALAQPVSAAFAARDWDWIRGRVSSDVVLEDRRSTVSSHRAVGPDAVVDLLRGFADVGFETLDNIHVASRGDRLALLRRVYRTATGYELQMLVVVETDAAGIIASIVLFDVHAMVPALDELEIRYARSGLTPHERQVVLGFLAVNHRAWNELDAVLAPDVTVFDHRRLGYPTGVGSEPLIDALRLLVEQVPDLVAIIERLESAGRAVLAENHQLGTSADGVVVDWQWHLVFALDSDGRIEQMEYFDADDEAAARARARYEELAGRDA